MLDNRGVARRLWQQLHPEGSGLHKDVEAVRQPSIRLTRPGVAPVDLLFVHVLDEAHLEADIPAATPAGTYDLTLTNPDSCAVQRAAASRVACVLDQRAMRRRLPGGLLRGKRRRCVDGL